MSNACLPNNVKFRNIKGVLRFFKHDQKKKKKISKFELVFLQKTLYMNTKF